MVIHMTSAGFRFSATKFDQASAQMVNLLHVGYGPKVFRQYKMCSENMNVEVLLKILGFLKTYTVYNCCGILEVCGQ